MIAGGGIKFKIVAMLLFRLSIFLLENLLLFLYEVWKETEKGLENAATDAAAYVPSLAVCRAVEILSPNAWSYPSFRGQ